MAAIAPTLGRLNSVMFVPSALLIAKTTQLLSLADVLVIAQMLKAASMAQIVNPIIAAAVIALEGGLVILVLLADVIQVSVCEEVHFRPQIAVVIAKGLPAKTAN